MEPYVSIDIETTGLYPENCQIIELAAVIDPDGKTPIEELPKFNSLIWRPSYQGESYALNMNASIFKELSEINIKKEPHLLEVNVMSRFEHFLITNSYAKYTPAGKNFAGFDKVFLSKMPIWYSISKILRHRTLDPGNLFWRPDKDGFILPDTKVCLMRAGLEPTQSHRALGDAIDVVRLIRFKLNELGGF